MIYVNEFSLVNALGANNEEILCNLSRNYSPGMSLDSTWLIGGKEAVFGHVITALPELSNDPRVQSRNNQLLLYCLLSKETEFRRLLASYDRKRIAVILGTSTSGSNEAAQFIAKDMVGQPCQFHSYAQELGDPARFLAGYLGLEGPAYTMSTSCTSSAHTFSTACRIIECGLVDCAIVGGADTLAGVTINGFNALSALSTSCCCPFAKNRKGMTIGEGAGLFFLSRRPADIVLLSYGESSDGYHMSAPEPTGLGAEAAMRLALEHAQLISDEITYVNLHGTGTVLNDSAEAQAMNRVFAGKVMCSSTKNLTGHTLGAAGATEAGIVCLLLSNQEARLPAQMNDKNNLDESLPSIGLIMKTTKVKKGPMMTNNFAFGGNNVSLIFDIADA